MRLLALIEELDDVARTLVTLREELNLVGREKWFGELRGPFAELTEALSHLSREIAEAVALAGKHVPHFKPGKDLRERVNDGADQPIRD